MASEAAPPNLLNWALVADAIVAAQVERASEGIWELRVQDRQALIRVPERIEVQGLPFPAAVGAHIHCALMAPKTSQRGRWIVLRHDPDARDAERMHGAGPMIQRRRDVPGQDPARRQALATLLAGNDEDAAIALSVLGIEHLREPETMPDDLRRLLAPCPPLRLCTAAERVATLDTGSGGWRWQSIPTHRLFTVLWRDRPAAELVAIVARDDGSHVRRDCNDAGFQAVLALFALAGQAGEAPGGDATRHLVTLLRQPPGPLDPILAEALLPTIRNPSDVPRTDIEAEPRLRESSIDPSLLAGPVSRRLVPDTRTHESVSKRFGRFVFVNNNPDFSLLASWGFERDSFARRVAPHPSFIEQLIATVRQRGIRPPNELAPLPAQFLDPAVAPRLAELLQDPAPAVRAFAAEGLGLMGHAASADALRHLRQDVAQPPEVRQSALLGLVGLGDAEALALADRVADQDSDRTDDPALPRPWPVVLAALMGRHPAADARWRAWLGIGGTPAKPPGRVVSRVRGQLDELPPGRRLDVLADLLADPGPGQTRASIAALANRDLSARELGQLERMLMARKRMPPLAALVAAGVAGKTVVERVAETVQAHAGGPEAAQSDWLPALTTPERPPVHKTDRRGSSIEEERAMTREQAELRSDPRLLPALAEGIGRHGLTVHLPLLWRLLASEQASVRCAAAHAIRLLTGTDAGFHSLDEVAARQEATRRWQALRR